MHIVHTGRIALISSLVLMALMAMAANVHAGVVELVSATGTLTATVTPAAGTPITNNFDITYETVGDDTVDANDNNGNQAGASFRHEGIGLPTPGKDFPLLLSINYILGHANGGSAAVSGSITFVTDRQLDYEVGITSFDGDRILTAALDGDTVSATFDTQPSHGGPLAPGTHLLTFSGATRTDIETPPFASGDFYLGLFPAGDVSPPPGAIPLPAGVYGGLTLFAAAGLAKRRLKLGTTRAQ